MSSTTLPDKTFPEKDDVIDIETLYEQEERIPVPEVILHYESFMPVSRGKEPNLVGLAQADLDRLIGKKFFNDEVVDFGLSVWYERFLASSQRNLRLQVYSTFFYRTYREKGYQGVARWCRRISPFDQDCIIIPASHNKHWFALIICNPRALLVPEQGSTSCTIICMDSLGYDRPASRKHALNWLRDEYNTRLLQGDIGSVQSKDIPCAQQPNGYDCGPYMIHNISCFVRHFKVVMNHIQGLPDSSGTLRDVDIWQPDLAKILRPNLQTHAQRCLRTSQQKP
ncbi:hypothetical protein M422DRAFT_274635 [Sphaerobolus stellatus SS14]|uniref:Ubiquitin-like protease family profile domain-containing protein n=1 Tax=Sphaerobolus stellatus (strain SS14) TaxID=990650 RepID=A0A0C9T6J4_SPHS4|nr:hypothetical protein M422DRAFT_274635 [Sphaerobolus stellatus SS14]